jgi:hypothetical protein
MRRSEMKIEILLDEIEILGLPAHPGEPEWPRVSLREYEFVSATIHCVIKAIH